MESKYLEGRVRVPLGDIQTDEVDITRSSFPTKLTDQLRHSGHTIPVRITPQTRDNILRALHYSPDQLHATIESDPAPLVNDHQVYFAATDIDLESAKRDLGKDYICCVQLYCIPVQPRSLSDGVIFQNVRYYMKSSWKKNRASVAQAWIDKLSCPKRKILASLLRHSDIIDAMDNMLCLPGYWEGHQLGNWAKHLAARINPLVINYWAHIKSVALKIMAGYEDKLHLFDANTVASLQYFAPSWNPRDRLRISQLFDDGTLFPAFQQKCDRDRLRDNILELTVSIPSIQTFHENMKYLTIGAKILEKYAENRPSESRATTIVAARRGLLDNLKNDWSSQNAAMEVGLDHQMARLEQPSVDHAIIQAFIAALRYFPYLSAEAPLRDMDKNIWMSGLIDARLVQALCKSLKIIGFYNSKIAQEAARPEEMIDIDYTPPKRRKDWRSGKPCMAGFYLLLQSSFFPRLFSDSTSDPPPLELLVQSDILQAFFGGKPSLPTLLHSQPSTEEQPAIADDDVDMNAANDNENGADRRNDTRAEIGSTSIDIAQSASPGNLNDDSALHLNEPDLPDIPATRLSAIFMDTNFAPVGPIHPRQYRRKRTATDKEHEKEPEVIRQAGKSEKRPVKRRKQPLTTSDEQILNNTFKAMPDRIPIPEEVQVSKPQPSRNTTNQELEIPDTMDDSSQFPLGIDTEG